MFFGERVGRSMSRKAITLKFKMSLLFPCSRNERKKNKQTATATKSKENKLKRL